MQHLIPFHCACVQNKPTSIHSQIYSCLYLTKDPPTEPKQRNRPFHFVSDTSLKRTDNYFPSLKFHNRRPEIHEPAAKHGETNSPENNQEQILSTFHNLEQHSHCPNRGGSCPSLGQQVLSQLSTCSSFRKRPRPVHLSQLCKARGWAGRPRLLSVPDFGLGTKLTIQAAGGCGRSLGNFKPKVGVGQT